MEKINLSEFGFNILQVETKSACNMACSFCPYPLKEDKTSILDFEAIKNILTQVNPKDPNFKYLTFSQFNEPLLDNRIFEIMKYAKGLGFKIYFVTNGLLLNKQKVIDELIKLKPDIKISLQIIEKGKHFQGRGLNLDLLKYSKTIFNFCESVKDKDIKVDIDIGCNFNDNKPKYLLRKILGLQAGDPSIINERKKTLEILNEFLDEMFKINNISSIEKINVKRIFNNKDFIRSNANLSDYVSQNGIKLAENIYLKLKPFFYGRRISNFNPLPSNAFLCKSEILGILSSGSIVPCCLAYDDKIALGNIKNYKLIDVLKENEFLKNLRSFEGKKHEVCQKCFGEPTKRGVIFRSIYNKFKRLINDQI